MEITNENWPVGVPRDLKDMMRQYERFIVSILFRRNKIERNFEDLCQYVFLKLCEVDVVGQFLARAEEMSAVLSFQDVLCVTGLSETQWRNASWYWYKGRHNPKYAGTRNITWWPEPLDSNVPLRDQRFQKEDIANLMLFGFFDESTLNPSKLPEVTAKHFQGYLARAVNNLFANWSRYEDRHHRERPAFHPVLTERDSWEDMLVSPTDPVSQVEARLDVDVAVQRVATLLKQYTLTDDNGLDAMVKDLSDGYTIREVIERLALPRGRKKAMLRAVHAALA